MRIGMLAALGAALSSASYQPVLLTRPAEARAQYGLRASPRSRYTGRQLRLIAADPSRQRRECARRLRQHAAGKLGLPLHPTKLAIDEAAPLTTTAPEPQAAAPKAKKPRAPRKPAAPKDATAQAAPKAPRKTAAKKPSDATAKSKAAPRKRAPAAA